MMRTHVPRWLLLAILIPASAPAQSRTPSSPTLTWSPERATEGQLFVLRVRVPTDARLGGIHGEVAGEALHFASTSPGLFETLAAVPVDTREGLDLAVTVAYEDGREEVLSATVPVAPGSYLHERLTVAPRFGAPPDDLLQCPHHGRPQYRILHADGHKGFAGPA